MEARRYQEVGGEGVSCGKSGWRFTDSCWYQIWVGRRGSKRTAECGEVRSVHRAGYHKIALRKTLQLRLGFARRQRVWRVSKVCYDSREWFARVLWGN